MTRAYYDLQTQIRPGWTLASRRSYKLRKNILSGHVGDEVPNPAKWKDAPHVAFANLMIEPKSVRVFNSTYGPLIADLDNIPEAGDAFEVNLTLLSYMQRSLQEVWRNPRSLESLWRPNKIESPNVHVLPVVFDSRASILFIADCWTYVRLMLQRDLQAGRARICKNDACITPYFADRRRDAKCCSRECVVNINVKRFREVKPSKGKHSKKRRKHGRLQKR